MRRTIANGDCAYHGFSALLNNNIPDKTLHVSPNLLRLYTARELVQNLDLIRGHDKIFQDEAVKDALTEMAWAGTCEA